MIQKRKIPFDILDSIRGIAALYVAIAHCRGTLWIGGSEFLNMFPRAGWDAWDYFMFGSSMLTRLAVEFVIVFFVLSGFSIAHSLSGETSVGQFYKRRFIRIYPSYVIALVWAGAVYFITKQWHPEWYDGSMNEFAFIRTNEMNEYLDPDVMAKNLAYIPQGGFITPFWSLTYEVMFYILAPFLLRSLKIYTIISIILFVINLFLQKQILDSGFSTILHEFIFVYNMYFLIGIHLYKNYEKVANLFTNVSKSAMIWMMIGVLLVMYAVNLYFKDESAYSFMVAAFLGVGLIIFFLKYNLRIPWLMGVGKFSYTLYITHFATIYLYLGIYWLIAKPDTSYILNYFVWVPGVVLVLIIAYIQYWLVEMRTKSILNMIRRKSAKEKE